MKFFERLFWFTLGAGLAATGLYALKTVKDDADPWEEAWEKSSNPAVVDE
ncbi:MAG: hypothetical protein LBT99_02615 [Bifidobacteriaceae bacterium]|jgi:hypothetical protein|nr:hypothetical protein [Bifidobacteriaceae bacterium]